jgi:hypothetical protein
MCKLKALMFELLPAAIVMGTSGRVNVHACRLLVRFEIPEESRRLY